MAEDFDGFEPQTDEKKEKPIFILGLFEAEPKVKTELAKHVHSTFLGLAKFVVKELPEGSPRTMLLERMLETKDTALRILETVR
jgi:hypothetical protein